MAVAAEDGSALPDLRYRVVAPEAALLVMTARYADQLVDALVWISSVASAVGQPVSVNLSLGSHSGSHDGARADELAIDAVCGPGMAVTCAAGNSDGMPIYATGSVPMPAARDSLAIAVGD